MKYPIQINFSLIRAPQILNIPRIFVFRIHDHICYCSNPRFLQKIEHAVLTNYVIDSYTGHVSLLTESLFTSQNLMLKSQKISHEFPKLVQNINISSYSI
jgi:hypothetical protein